MSKLILIDGNSLLNRAFYAMNVFSTKDGLPTNGIFGFVKLLLKIASDEKPDYLAVTFDVHAPTFRHTMYDAYKGTRKPMPEELKVQVPVLKDLLHSMKVCTVELAGYEADDLIGTLSRRFPEVDVLIYTGDRDSYQLVKEHVDVCFTKRGVSDLDRLTADNFRTKVGLEPAQIIDEKALMGDASDNIPGVRGIGPKGALALLEAYGTLDGVYSHLDEIAPSTRQKLTECRESAYLSRTLATIDCNVPLNLSLSDCAFRMPFPAEARTFFSKLEFRSLIDEALFTGGGAAKIETVVCSDLSALMDVIGAGKRFSLALLDRSFHLFDGKREYAVALKADLLDAGVYLADLRPVFSLLFSEGRTVIAADGKALAHALDPVGVELGEVEDVALLRYLGDSNLRPITPADLAKEFDLPEDNCAYALWLAFDDAARRTEGTAEAKLYRDLELPLSKVLLDMERTGVRVDVKRFPEFSERFRGRLEELSSKIYSLAGVEPFNLNSTFRLSEVLFDKLGYKPVGAKKNIRGGYSTNADVLEALAEEHEIARLILNYREVQKLQSTYIDGIRPLIEGEVVHTTYNQTATTTGRLSSANPNLQNIPVRTDLGRELRMLFIPREGNLFIDADYSQIELRLLAHFSGSEALLEAYRAGEDVHAATASRVFGVPLSEVTPVMRRRAKTINFGIIYGMSAFGLAKDLGCSGSEAQSFITKYFATHPGVREYMDENIRLAKENGYVTTILGRKRYIPEVRSSNFNLRSFGERAAMNMPLQGSAADIIKLAMLGVERRLRAEGLKTRMVLQVHDELILDAPLGEVSAAERILKEEMEGAIELKVPLIAEVSTGKSWYEAK